MSITPSMTLAMIPKTIQAATMTRSSFCPIRPEKVWFLTAASPKPEAMMALRRYEPIIRFSMLTPIPPIA